MTSSVLKRRAKESESVCSLFCHNFQFMLLGVHCANYLHAIKVITLYFSCRLKRKKMSSIYLKLFRFNINYHGVLFFICIDNISKSDQVLCVLPSKWLHTDEVAKICIAKSKHTLFSFYLYLFVFSFYLR